MTYDRKIKISAAGDRRSLLWPAQEILLSELWARLQTPVRSTETQAEYMRMKKPQQDALKDVGGFVAGTLREDRRRAGHVLGRDLITLDMDSIPPGGTADVLRALDGLGCGYCVYSTRKHRPDAPRLRVLLPLDRVATADEYEPIARRAAQLIAPGMKPFDPSTFEASRLMYWPSVSADGEYIFHWADKPLLSTDGMLATYAEWTDCTAWPQVPGAAQARKKHAAKQENPREKRGVLGAFCRCYDIYGAMERFIPGIYAPTAQHDRWTYAGGSTTGGAVIYDDGLFLYSHHATDPASGRLCNAFDLVRLHLYGDLDLDAKDGTPANKYPSFSAMCKLAVSDETVAALLDRERYDEAVADFTAESAGAETDTSWMKKLRRNPNTGAYEKTVDNILLILERDPQLSGRIALDTFAQRGVAVGPYPWDKSEVRRVWNDNDDAGVRWYLEKVYNITGAQKVLDALSICGNLHAEDPVRSYLESLQWDGKPRLDTVFVDYLGAADTPYTRAVTRKALCAAVARAIQPGVKFDNMVILNGAQGIGKSTLLRVLAHGWFSDSLKTFEGKEACELIQGVWLIEIAELEAMARSEVGRIKQFLSQSEDIFRQPYGRRTNLYPRRCVFFGTSNNNEYLRDRTGNRRFWPVDTGIATPKKSVFDELPGEIDQIWAEAVVRWSFGETLYLKGDIAKAALEEQEDHREHSPREGIIREFLERPVPPDWSRWKPDARRIFWADATRYEGELRPRDRICAAEIWCEALGGDLKQMKYADAQEINGVLRSMDGWERTKKATRFGCYGAQKGFIRREDTADKQSAECNFQV